MAGLPKKYIKAHGISKKAWREYRKDQAAKGKPTRKRSRATTGKKKGGGGGGKKTFGQFGITGLLISGVLLALAKFLVRSYTPQAGAYTSGVSAVAAGGASKLLGLTGKSMFGLGLVELVSEAVTDIMLPGGMVTGPWVSAPSRTNGGYQF